MLARIRIAYSRLPCSAQRGSLPIYSAVAVRIVQPLILAPRITFRTYGLRFLAGFLLRHIPALCSIFSAVIYPVVFAPWGLACWESTSCFALKTG